MYDLGLCLYVAGLLLREPPSAPVGRLWLAHARMLQGFLTPES